MLTVDFSFLFFFLDSRSAHSYNIDENLFYLFAIVSSVKSSVQRSLPDRRSNSSMCAFNRDRYTASKFEL